MLVKEMEERGAGFPESARWLNLVLPLLVYALLSLCLVLVLYRCFVYFRARAMHEFERVARRKRHAAVESTQVESLI